MRVGVWVPLRTTGRPGEPTSWPLGRAAARARALGVEVVIGRPVAEGRFAGYELAAAGWREVEGRPVGAVFDRFSSVRDPRGWAAGLAMSTGLPIGNPPELNDLCRDKLVAQRVLEGAGLPLPPLVDLSTSAFVEPKAPGATRVFVKPRFGSFGEGVAAMTAAEAAARWRRGELAGEAWVVQRAVLPPEGWAGVSLRVLVQRVPELGWVARSPVVRRSRHDPVVNASRGAELVPADGDLARRAGALAVRAAQALHAETRGAAVELGADLVVDQAGDLWVIEVNGRPRGRLLALAKAWPEPYFEEHVSACAQPLLTLATDAATAAR